LPPFQAPSCKLPLQMHKPIALAHRMQFPFRHPTSLIWPLQPHFFSSLLHWMQLPLAKRFYFFSIIDLLCNTIC
jgi:hypothetical protein